MDRPPRGRLPGRAIAVLAAFAIVAASLVASWAVDTALDPVPGPNEYNVPAWTVREFPNKWLFLLGQRLHGRPEAEEEDRILARFFALVGEVEALERGLSDANRRDLRDPALEAEVDARRRERDRLARQATATIEGRITAVLEEEGIVLGLPLLGSLVWPPVNFEFTTPPRTLAVSPRDRIELKSTTLLRDGLTTAEVEAIEDRREQRDGVSALAFPVGGVGLYPAIVTYTTDYRRAVDTAAHEWMHNYLFFKPLGIRYFQSADLRTLNETVANIVGKEVADAVLARWPLPALADDGVAPPPTAPSPRPDANEELRRLRLEVDDLLGRGLVDQAEALMEERRRELWDRGLQYRKLNQAFFAFVNLYAGERGSPGAVNPIGPKLDELRRRSPTLGAFVRLVEGFRGVEDLDRALKAAPP